MIVQVFFFFRGLFGGSSVGRVAFFPTFDRYLARLAFIFLPNPPPSLV